VALKGLGGFIVADDSGEAAPAPAVPIRAPVTHAEAGVSRQKPLTSSPTNVTNTPTSPLAAAATPSTLSHIASSGHHQHAASVIGPVTSMGNLPVNNTITTTVEPRRERRPTKKMLSSVFEGWLMVMESARVWARRYFVLVATNITVYNERDDSDPVVRWETAGLKLREEADLDGYSFSLQPTTGAARGKKVALQADTADDRELWLSALSACVALGPALLPNGSLPSQTSLTRLASPSMQPSPLNPILNQITQTITAAPPNGIVFTGTMRMQGEKMKEWMPMHFVLAGSLLLWFDNEAATRRRDLVPPTQSLANALGVPLHPVIASTTSLPAGISSGSLTSSVASSSKEQKAVVSSSASTPSTATSLSSSPAAVVTSSTVGTTTSTATVSSSSSGSSSSLSVTKVSLANTNVPSPNNATSGFTPPPPPGPPPGWTGPIPAGALVTPPSSSAASSTSPSTSAPTASTPSGSISVSTSVSGVSVSEAAVIAAPTLTSGVPVNWSAVAVNARGCMPLWGCNVVLAPSAHPSMKWCFALHGPKKILRLCCDSEQQLRDWNAQLNMMIATFPLRRYVYTHWSGKEESTYEGGRKRTLSKVKKSKASTLGPGGVARSPSKVGGGIAIGVKKVAEPKSKATLTPLTVITETKDDTSSSRSHTFTLTQRARTKLVGEEEVACLRSQLLMLLSEPTLSAFFRLFYRDLDTQRRKALDAELAGTPLTTPLATAIAALKESTTSPSPIPSTGAAAATPADHTRNNSGGVTSPSDASNTVSSSSSLTSTTTSSISSTPTVSSTVEAANIAISETLYQWTGTRAPPSSKYLTFYLAAADFAVHPVGSEFQQRLARRIYNRFFAHGALHELFIDTPTRLEILETMQLHRVPQTLFTKAQAIVIDIIAIDVLPRYLQLPITSRWSLANAIRAQYDRVTAHHVPRPSMGLASGSLAATADATTQGGISTPNQRMLMRPKSLRVAPPNNMFRTTGMLDVQGAQKAASAAAAAEAKNVSLARPSNSIGVVVTVAPVIATAVISYASTGSTTTTSTASATKSSAPTPGAPSLPLVRASAAGPPGTLAAGGPKQPILTFTRTPAIVTTSTPATKVAQSTPSTPRSAPPSRPPPIPPSQLAKQGEKKVVAPAPAQVVLPAKPSAFVVAPTPASTSTSATEQRRRSSSPPPPPPTDSQRPSLSSDGPPPPPPEIDSPNPPITIRHLSDPPPPPPPPSAPSSPDITPRPSTSLSDPPPPPPPSEPPPGAANAPLFAPPLPEKVHSRQASEVPPPPSDAIDTSSSSEKRPSAGNVVTNSSSSTSSSTTSSSTTSASGPVSAPAPATGAVPLPKQSVTFSPMSPLIHPLMALGKVHIATDMTSPAATSPFSKDENTSSKPTPSASQSLEKWRLECRKLLLNEAKRLPAKFHMRIPPTAADVTSDGKTAATAAIEASQKYHRLHVWLSMLRFWAEVQEYKRQVIDVNNSSLTEFLSQPLTPDSINGGSGVAEYFGANRATARALRRRARRIYRIFIRTGAPAPVSTTPLQSDKVRESLAAAGLQGSMFDEIANGCFLRLAQYFFPHGAATPPNAIDFSLLIGATPIDPASSSSDKTTTTTAGASPKSNGMHTKSSSSGTFPSVFAASQQRGSATNIATGIPGPAPPSTPPPSKHAGHTNSTGNGSSGNSNSYGGLGSGAMATNMSGSFGGGSTVMPSSPNSAAAQRFAATTGAPTSGPPSLVKVSSVGGTIVAVSNTVSTGGTPTSAPVPVKAVTMMHPRPSAIGTALIPAKTATSPTSTTPATPPKLVTTPPPTISTPVTPVKTASSTSPKVVEKREDEEDDDDDDSDISLTLVLGVSRFCGYFRRWLVAESKARGGFKEGGNEPSFTRSLSFYSAIEEYRRISNPDLLNAMARRVYTRFVLPSFVHRSGPLLLPSPASGTLINGSSSSSSTAMSPKTPGGTSIKSPAKVATAASALNLGMTPSKRNEMIEKKMGTPLPTLDDPLSQPGVEHRKWTKVQLPLTPKTLDGIATAMKTNAPGPHVFLLAQREIFVVLHRLWPIFKRSQYYSRMVKRCRSLKHLAVAASRGRALSSVFHDVTTPLQLSDASMEQLPCHNGVWIHYFSQYLVTRFCMENVIFFAGNWLITSRD
jgi:hypothetical protein